jgi:hypothetical protein
MLGIIAAIRSPLLHIERKEKLLHPRGQAHEAHSMIAALHLVLATKDNRVRGAELLQQVLGEIQPRVREERGAWHLVAGDQHRARPLPDNAAKIPDKGPERLAVVDRPSVKFGIGGEGAAAPGRGCLHESGHRCRVDLFLRRGPEWCCDGHDRSSFRLSWLMAALQERCRLGATQIAVPKPPRRLSPQAFKSAMREVAPLMHIAARQSKNLFERALRVCANAIGGP